MYYHSALLINSNVSSSIGFYTLNIRAFTNIFSSNTLERFYRPILSRLGRHIIIVYFHPFMNVCMHVCMYVCIESDPPLLYSV